MSVGAARVCCYVGRVIRSFAQIFRDTAHVSHAELERCLHRRRKSPPPNSKSFATRIQPYGMSSAFGTTFGARRRYLSISFGFAVPARARRKSSAARKEPTFSATAAAMNWFNDTPSVAANSAAAFFTDVGSFNG